MQAIATGPVMLRVLRRMIGCAALWRERYWSTEEPLKRANNSCTVAANLVLTAVHQERHRVPGFQCCLEKIVVSIDPEFQTPTTPLNREAHASPLRGQLRIDRDFVAVQ